MKIRITLIAFAILLFCGAALADPIITVANTTASGGIANVTVSVTGAKDIYSFQFDVHFDPAIVSVTGDTAAGSLFDLSGNSFIPLGATIDNVGGNYFSAGYVFFGNSAGVNGNGLLLTLNFNANVGPAFSFVTIDDILLLDSNLNPIDFTENDGSITTTPEPGSLALLGSGFLGLGGAIRRKLIA